MHAKSFAHRIESATAWGRGACAAAAAASILYACADEPGERLARARSLAATGDYVAAVELLDGVLAAGGRDVPARTLRAELALVGGEAARAERELRRARDDGASEEEILRPLGRALLAQGAFERVLTEIPRSVRSVRQSAQLLALHGRAHAGLGEADEARRTFEEALRLDERCIEALIGVARVAREQQRFEEAETLGWRAIALDPSSVAAWRERGVLEYERAHHAEAEQAFERALTTAGDRYWTEEGVLASTGLAETLWRRNRREAARARLDEIDAHVPGHPVVLYLRALFALESGDHDAVGQHIHALLTRHGEYPAAFALLGLSALERGDATAASALLERAVALRPRDPVGRELLARALIASGDAAAGVEALLPAAAAGSADESFLVLLGRGRLAAGDVSGGVAALTVAARVGAGASAEAAADGAEEQLVTAMHERASGVTLESAERLLAQRPESLLGMLGMAQAAQLDGDGDDALAWLARARSGHPLAAEPRMLLARHALATGDLDGAATHARDGVAVAPFDAEAHATLGYVRLRAGNAGAARRSLRLAMLFELRNPQRHVQYAAAQLAAGDLARAVATLAIAVRMPGVDMQAIGDLVRAEGLGGRSTQALALARELQRMQPASAAAYAAEADLHLLEGRFAAAEAAYGAAAAHESSRLLALKSFLVRRAAGVAEPGTPIARWLERHPDDRRMRLVLAQACVEGGQRRSAIRHYERVLAADSGNPIAIAALGRLLIMAGGGEVSVAGSC